MKELEYPPRSKSVDSNLRGVSPQKDEPKRYSWQLTPAEREKWRIKVAMIPRNRFKCGICSTVLASKRSAIAHIRYHFNIRPWKCFFCTHRSHTESNRSAHINRHHQVEKAARAGWRGRLKREIPSQDITGSAESEEGNAIKRKIRKGKLKPNPIRESESNCD